MDLWLHGNNYEPTCDLFCSKLNEADAFNLNFSRTFWNIQKDNYLLFLTQIVTWKLTLSVTWNEKRVTKVTVHAWNLVLKEIRSLKVPVWQQPVSHSAELKDFTHLWTKTGRWKWGGMNCKRCHTNISWGTSGTLGGQSVARFATSGNMKHTLIRSKRSAFAHSGWFPVDCWWGCYKHAKLPRGVHLGSVGVRKETWNIWSRAHLSEHLKWMQSSWSDED